jgi:hypothetical protein
MMSGSFNNVDQQNKETIMNEQQKRLFLIKIAYWLGIGADALWAVGLLFPRVFGMLTGNPDFHPDVQTRLIMGIGASLMTGWTFLLVWALRKPIERRGVILLTAFPVVFGLFIVALIGFLGGNTWNLWLLIKTIILIISMVTSYILAGKMDKKEIDTQT